MILDEPSTIHPWGVQAPGPINLRAHHVARHVQRGWDLEAAEGVILSVLIGLNLIVWPIALLVTR